MAKSAETASNIEYPTFDTSAASDQLRVFAEKGVEQSKEAYARMKTGAEETQKAMESTFQTAKSASTDLSLKTIAAMRSNAEAGFSHLEALANVKSLSDLVELQTGFMRKRIEVAVEQAKDFQTSATKAAEDFSRPMKDVVEKAFRELKVA